ncbi:MAG: hypothetical protein IJG94_07030 [Clostridia bacterium]|nr:hypothetical protein [Clostridia bacterium]
MNTENSRHTLPAVFLHAAPIRFTAGKGKRQEYGEISPWKNHFLETEGPVYCMKKRIAAAIVRFRIGILICILIVATWSVFQIGRTNINYDLTRYLSDDTMTKKALAVMQEEFGGVPAAKILGHSVRELYPHIGEEWFREIKRAALDGETVEGEMTNALDGERYHYTVRQIIYPGYCAVTYTRKSDKASGAEQLAVRMVRC